MEEHANLPVALTTAFAQINKISFCYSLLPVRQHSH